MIVNVGVDHQSMLLVARSYMEVECHNVLKFLCKLSYNICFVEPCSDGNESIVGIFYKYHG